MDAKDSFTRMFQLLEIHEIYVTPQFYKDICKLVKTDISKFIQEFSRDFMRKKLKDYNRFERLKTTSIQNKKLEGKALYRYEYRNTSNLRCIYIVEDVNTNKIILLNAFNENMGKKIGKNSYDFNIERAIKSYEECKWRNVK